MQNQSNTLPLPVQCTVNLNPYKEVSVRIRGALRLDALHALRFKVLELVTSASVELPPSSPMFLHEERPVRHVSTNTPVHNLFYRVIHSFD
uniref:Uncharacterized protein n=1 Tax=Hucho hucho TaxID=62062 RepID=A0A4W5JZS7_9TELE